MTRLLLLAYGRPTEYARAAFAALSAWAWAPTGYGQLAAVVYTDQPAALAPYLAALPVDYQVLTEARLTELRGPRQYVHRIKACVVLEASAAYPGDELLFIDSDTFFIAAPGPLLQQLAAGTVFLHQPEYTLAEAVGIYAAFSQARYPRRLLEHLTGRSFQLAGAEVRFRPYQTCWNSGVLGLPPALAPLLPDTLAMLDDFYAASEWFTCEQVAFSLALQTAGPLAPAGRYIYHYWAAPQKTLADQLLTHALTPALAALPLLTRLRQVRQLIPEWHAALKHHQARHDALYSLGQGQLGAGLRCAAKALLADPFDLEFMRQFGRALRWPRS